MEFCGDGVSSGRGVPHLGTRGIRLSGLGSGSWGKGEHGHARFGFFFTWLVKGACVAAVNAPVCLSPAITQSTSAPFDRDAKAGKIPSSYRSSENRSLEDLGDFRGR